jgi:hypothetical protein
MVTNLLKFWNIDQNLKVGGSVGSIAKNVFFFLSAIYIRKNASYSGFACLDSLNDAKKKSKQSYLFLRCQCNQVIKF